MEVARELRERYRVTGVLVSAAQAGYIAELRCGMEYCFAAAQDRFEPLGIPLGPWMPTHEHFPLAKRFRGTREVTNAVLAHRRCTVGYKIEELREHLEGLRLETEVRFTPTRYKPPSTITWNSVEPSRALSTASGIAQASHQDRARDSRIARPNRVTKPAKRGYAGLGQCSAMHPELGTAPSPLSCGR